MNSIHKKIRNKYTYKKKSKTKNKHSKTKNKNTRRIRHTFSNNDYISSDGMLTNVWGPSLWHFLHIISFNYPIEPTNKQKQYYKKFVLSLEYILPCKYCRINFKKNMKSLPLTYSVLKNRYTFSKYMYDLHELINSMLGKNQIYHMMMLEIDTNILEQDVLLNQIRHRKIIIRIIIIRKIIIRIIIIRIIIN